MNSHKPLSRNFAGQKGIPLYVQKAERKDIAIQEYSTWPSYSKVKETL